jgi:hypothetical protein
MTRSIGPDFMDPAKVNVKPGLKHFASRATTPQWLVNVHYWVWGYDCNTDKL